MKQFFIVLWDKYDYNVLLVLAALASVLIEPIRTEWSPPTIMATSLLVICLLYFGLRAWVIRRSLYPAPQIPFAVCVGKPQDWFDSFARRQQESCLRAARAQWDEVQRTYRIHRLDWVFLYSGTLSQRSDEWKAVTRRLLNHFWQLQNRVDHVPTHHFFFIAPAAITFAFGAYVGRRVPSVVYHFVGGADPYVQVADTTKRDVSQGLDLFNRRIAPGDFRHIVVESQQLTGEGPIIIALDFTNHRTAPPYLEQASARELVRVSHTDGVGHLPTAGWENLAREVASLVLGYVDDGHDVDLYINTPLALAFLMGAITGAVRGVTLCEFNAYLQEYIRCFELADPDLHSTVLDPY